MQYINRRSALGTISGIVCLTGTHQYLQAAGEDIAGGAYTRQLTELVTTLKKDGHDISAYFEHPSFTLHEDIDAKFLKSAEKTGIDAYREAVKTGDEEHSRQVFEDEYSTYRNKVGYIEKQNGILPFMKEHAAKLAESETTYGIPAEVIAAVIGIESNYGAVIGKYFAFNVYVSMYARDYRKSFALTQLEELLTFSETRDFDIFAVKSSYAGAMGYMQFIPASLNRWFVGHDLYDMDDNIASVANYLAHFKKERGDIERAVFSYNPSELYTRTVLDLAAYAETHHQ